MEIAVTTSHPIVVESRSFSPATKHSMDAWKSLFGVCYAVSLTVLVLGRVTKGVLHPDRCYKFCAS